MTVDRPLEYLQSLIRELCQLSHETEWIEFKVDNEQPEAIGEYISALANAAAYCGKVHAYIIWGIENNTHKIVGTKFNPLEKKIGSEELESWLLRLLNPKINFKFFDIEIDDQRVVMLEVGAAFRHPVQFKNTEYIRIGSYKKKLKDFPEKERELWRIFDRIPFEKEVAAEHLTAEDVLFLLDYPAYFDLLHLPFPESSDGILNTLCADELITKSTSGKWNISNLGAILFARKLSDFSQLKFKAVRVILYSRENKFTTIREQVGSRGYACGFEGLIGFVKNLLPLNEVIGQALRKNVSMFPELSVRELIANAIIHQDFHIIGTAPLIEIYSNRMEITNPGLPLVKTDRFLDSPPKSRNEALASFMRRIGVCEERGSGIDKVVIQTEIFQLPAPIFETTDEHTRAILFAHKDLKEMDKTDRIRACYMHAGLRFIQRDFMTNTTLRERFCIDNKNSAIASRIIKDTLDEKLIYPFDSESSKKYMKYIPWWAR
ncbi:MAG: putative DNA binding domain-containing protein [Desulfamplus sp.]|nr:putative DNA binding domain-containing protein [Desulfamplus sp.]